MKKTLAILALASMLLVGAAPHDNVTMLLDTGGGGGGGSETDFIDASYNTFAYYPLDTADVCNDFFSSNNLTESGTIAHATGLARGESLDNQDGNNYCQATLSVAWPWNGTSAFSFGGWFSPQADPTTVRNAIQLGARTEIRDPGNSNGGNAYRIERDNANWHPTADNLGNYTVSETRMIYVEYDGAGTWKIISNGGTATPTGGGSACTGGVETNSRTHTADTNDRLTIGGPGNDWDMHVDEIAIFSDVMTEADICLAYQQGCWGDGGSCS